MSERRGLDLAQAIFGAGYSASSATDDNVLQASRMAPDQWEAVQALRAQLAAAQAEADRLRADLEVVVQRGRGLANDCAIAKREVERLRAALREIARAALASPETEGGE